MAIDNDKLFQEPLKPSMKSFGPEAAAPPHRCTGSTKPGRLLTLLPALCCAFMLYSSFTAIVDSHGDPSTVFFVVASLIILGLLYLSMRQFEKAVAKKDDVNRDGLKIAIWLLAILLNILFSYRVTSVLQSPVMTGVIWAIAAVTSLLGCYLLFFLPRPSTGNNEPQREQAAADPEGGGYAQLLGRPICHGPLPPLLGPEAMCCPSP